MNQNETPLFDSSEAATKHAIEVSGKTLKAVGSMLWPDKTPDGARTALANALNENRQERLTADQHIAIATFCRQYHWLHFAACRCSHSRPILQTPERRAAELQEQFLEKASAMRSLLDEIDRLKGGIGSVE